MIRASLLQPPPPKTAVVVILTTRLEPFVLGGGPNLPPPEIVPTWTGGLRVQYKFKKMREDVWNLVFSKRKVLEKEIESWLRVLGLMDEDEGAVQNNDPTTARQEEDRHSRFVNTDPVQGSQEMGNMYHSGKRVISSPLYQTPSSNTTNEKSHRKDDNNTGISKNGLEQKGPAYYGCLAGGQRIDYLLQEKEIEVTNEYIFAITAHVLYWQNKDLSLFIARHLYDKDV